MEKPMLFKIKVKGAGVFTLPFPSNRAARVWADVCFPRCPPASVFRVEMAV